MNQIVNAAPMAMGAVSARFANVPVENDLAEGISGGYGLLTYKGKVWTIRHRGVDRQLMRPDGDGPMNSVEVVILKGATGLSKIWYENGYVEGSNAPPDCSSSNGVIPDNGVPKKQNNVCATCPRNAWGSDRRGGKGKDCADSRRVAIVPLTDIPNEAFGGPMLLRIPAASLQDMAAFSSQMQGQGYPYFSIGIRISFDTQESFPKFKFNGIRPLSDAEADMVLRLRTSPEVERIVSEAPPAVQQIAQEQPQQQMFEQPPQTQQTVVQQPVQQQQVVQPAPVAAQVQQPAPVVNGGGFGGVAAPAPTQAPVAAPQVAQQPAPVVNGGGFGGVVAPASTAQQPAQTAGPAPVAVQGAAPQTATATQSVANPETGGQSGASNVGGFGGVAQQSFPDAANGIAQPAAAQQQTPVAPVNAEFEASLDQRLAALMGNTTS